MPRSNAAKLATARRELSDLYRLGTLTAAAAAAAAAANGGGAGD